MNLIIQLRLSNIGVSTFSDEEYVISLNSCTELKYIYPYCVLSPFLVLSLSANKKKSNYNIPFLKIIENNYFDYSH